ncbi:hypothetical protein LWF15_10085 [Kineosporia rhizophila]|uniref:hypothetical protein n=1 Tax=Kineosporia rhizophila TaxID=84633 RepID=UPI000AF8EFE5|nr:hypothetical protein [Kineosporia rhizophila]MCE0535861.1 hypothetical protein [Kineosporia rhizophila]
MSEPVKKYLRWVLGAEGAPEFDASEYDSVKTLKAAGISLFTISLERYFPQEPTPSEAAALVTKIRQMLVRPEELNPVLAERVVLSGYGHEGLLDDVPETDIARVENMISFGIRRELKIDDGPELERFLDEIVEFMNSPLDD